MYNCQRRYYIVANDTATNGIHSPDAPLIRPAMSVICKYAGTIETGCHKLHRKSNRASKYNINIHIIDVKPNQQCNVPGTGQRLSFGSIVQTKMQNMSKN